MATEIKKVGDNHYQIKGMPAGKKEEMDLLHERLSNPACRKGPKMQTEEEKQQCRAGAKEKAVQRRNDMMKETYGQQQREAFAKADQEYEEQNG